MHRTYIMHTYMQLSKNEVLFKKKHIKLQKFHIEKQIYVCERNLAEIFLKYEYNLIYV